MARKLPYQRLIQNYCTIYNLSAMRIKIMLKTLVRLNHSLNPLTRTYLKLLAKEICGIWIIADMTHSGYDAYESYVWYGLLKINTGFFPKTLFCLIMYYLVTRVVQAKNWNLKEVKNAQNGFLQIRFPLKFLLSVALSDKGFLVLYLL